MPYNFLTHCLECSTLNAKHCKFLTLLLCHKKSCHFNEIFPVLDSNTFVVSDQSGISCCKTRLSTELGPQ